MIATIIKYCDLFVLNLNKDKVRLFLKTSPQYPSLLSIIRTLQFVGLETHAIKCDIQHLKEIINPFLLHLCNKNKDTIVIVKWETDMDAFFVYNIHKRRWTHEKIEDIVKIWDGVVIYTDASLKKKNWYNWRSIIVALFSILILCSVKISPIGFRMLPILIGFSISFYLFIKRFGYENKILNTICHISKVTDCNLVSESRFGKVQGIRLCSLSAAYFLSQFALLFPPFSTIPYQVLFFISALSFLPIGCYTIIAQIKLGKICPFCILLFICLVMEVIFFFLQPQRKVSIQTLYVWGLLFSMTLLILIQIEEYKKNLGEHMQIQEQLLKLKRRDIQTQRGSGLLYTREISSPIVIGSKSSCNRVIVFISPSCSHCKRMMKHLLQLRKDAHLPMSIEIVWADAHQEDSILITEWTHLYLTQKDTFDKMFESWCFEKTCNLSPFSVTNADFKEKLESVRLEFKRIAKQYKIKEFPRVVINGKLLPEYYLPADLEYLLFDQQEMTS